MLAGLRALGPAIVAGKGGVGVAELLGPLSRVGPARPSCRSRGAKMSGGENPASKPTPVQDVQGDGRWMSLVSDPAYVLRSPEGASGEQLFGASLYVIRKPGNRGGAA